MKRVVTPQCCWTGLWQVPTDEDVYPGVHPGSQFTERWHPSRAGSHQEVILVLSWSSCLVTLIGHCLSRSTSRLSVHRTMASESCRISSRGDSSPFLVIMFSYTHRSLFIQEYIQALSSQNDGIRVVQDLIKR